MEPLPGNTTAGTVKAEWSVTMDQVREVIETAFDGCTWIRATSTEPDTYKVQCIHPDTGRLEEDWSSFGEQYEGIKFLDLNTETIITGLGLTAKDYPSYWSDFIEENLDVTGAEVILQMGLFGSIIVG